MSDLHASPNFAPPPGNPRFEAMDGLRGLMVIGIVTCHASSINWNNGYVGALDFSFGMVIYGFFALSAFLLYRPYIAARAAGRSAPGTGKFLRRRALRVIPAYWVALTLLAIWPGLPGFSDHWFAFYGFIQIYRPEWAGGLGQAWSICVEVTFYLCLPLYAAGVRRILPRRSWLAVELGAALVLILAGLGVRAWAAAGHLSPWTVIALPAWLPAFGLGMGLAALSVGLSTGALDGRVRTLLRRGATAAPFVAGGLILAQAAIFGLPDPIYLWMLPLSEVGSELGRQVLLVCIALFLLWGAAFGRPQSLFHRVLNLRSIVWLGVVSYSFYLYHVTIVYKLMIWATSNQVDFFGHQTLGLILLALAVSAPVAYLSYRYVEFPFLSRKEVRRRRRPVADRAPVPPSVPEPALPERVAT